MFKGLKSRFHREGAPATPHNEAMKDESSTVSYLDGAYRLHRLQDVARFTAMAVEAFPELGGRIECFGADWLGCQFAIDRARILAGDPQVLLLEPGTGEALEIPAGTASFHERLLVEEADAVVAHSFYKEWLSIGGTRPGYYQCIGYKRPLFLGGQDDVANLEVADLEVYWSVSGQLLAQVRDLPVGTKIGSVTIGP
jgi:hypothetical protein